MAHFFVITNTLSGSLIYYHSHAPTEKGAVFVRQLLFSCNISYADYAITMVDEIEKGHHINQRISVVGA